MAGFDRTAGGQPQRRERDVLGPHLGDGQLPKEIRSCGGSSRRTSPAARPPCPGSHGPGYRGLPRAGWGMRGLTWPPVARTMEAERAHRAGTHRKCRPCRAGLIGPRGSRGAFRTCCQKPDRPPIGEHDG